jgi:hypothetical protein
MGLLFPDAARQTAAQNNQRGTGAQYVGGQTAASSGAGLSERRKKQTTVIVVPDTRTKSLLVTASKDTMTQIATLIADLDYSAAGVPRVYVYCPQNADVADLQSPLSELFASSTRSSSGTLVNVLLQRANQGAQTSTTTTTSISSTGGSTGGK